ncbi:Tetrathionate reductase subunit B [Dissulfuribacter thermophilus]|uniref:Tetrathionate reductase subunit B n=1 Tax=Dissulfuribacter thermophilus TaxID=1156395 RepID=A0A1B9F6B7_9BACT|nr:4Fe-4S dicluster domain-containing protein [Dissulfuribacter thermophilus]OCC15498.1 Tetrathionate reductase subunit B [Dissulfuribacter thermophilus]
MNSSRRSFIKLLGGAAASFSILKSPDSAQATQFAGKSEAKWGMVIDLRKCIGCQACTVACSIENQIPVGKFRTIVSTYEIERYGTTHRINLPRLCNHCEKPACVQVCPTQATKKRKDGIVVVDNSVCVGCGYCIQACPYEARFINPLTRTADKCTFCLHRLEAGLYPACVETCVGEARVFGNFNDPNSKVSRLVSQYPVQVLKRAMGTGPMVFYIGLDETLSGQIKGEAVISPAGSGVEEEVV